MIDEEQERKAESSEERWWATNGMVARLVRQGVVEFKEEAGLTLLDREQSLGP